VGLGLAFCRCEKCSHGLGALKRSSKPLSGKQQAEGASGQVTPSSSGRNPPTSDPQSRKESFTVTQFQINILDLTCRYPSFVTL